MSSGCEITEVSTASSAASLWADSIHFIVIELDISSLLRGWCQPSTLKEPQPSNKPYCIFSLLSLWVFVYAFIYFVHVNLQLGKKLRFVIADHKVKCRRVFQSLKSYRQKSKFCSKRLKNTQTWLAQISVCTVDRWECLFFLQ